MDLSLLQDSLSDFATLGKNLGAAFTGVPELLLSIVEFFNSFGDNTETTSDAANNLSS